MSSFLLLPRNLVFPSLQPKRMPLSDLTICCTRMLRQSHRNAIWWRGR